MILQIATNKDSSDLIEFFESFPIKGSIEYKIDRHEDFFKFYDLLSNEHVTYLLREENGSKQIGAIVTFIIKNVQYEGKTFKIAYGYDLRVSPSRKAILNWSQYFLPIFNEIRDKYQCKYIFSSLNMTETQSLNAFVRPKLERRPLPRYYTYKKYHQISLHGHYPWANKPLTSIEIRKAEDKDLPALIFYIIQKNQKKPFSTIWDEQSFSRTFSHQKINPKDMLLAFDQYNNIIGCTALWSHSKTQDFIPLKYSAQVENFRQFLNFGKYINITHPLPKSFEQTQMEDYLKPIYLTHLYCDNPDIFESIIWHCFESIEEDEFLIYNHVDGDLMLNPPSNWICGSIPHTLYALLEPGEKIPDFLHPSLNTIPEIL